MARNRGSFNFAANFEVLAKAPLDARLVVDTKANLIDSNIWEDANTNVWLYKGIVVSVVSDPSPSNNGLYFLTDETDYQNPNAWIKIESGSTIDASGTSSISFQLNNGDEGVILKDASGNLEIFTSDGSTYANFKASNIEASSLRIDTLNGALYAIDGSVYSAEGTVPLKGFDGIIYGNGSTSNFTIDHSLNTLRQVITVYDASSVIYPDLERGLNTNIISFVQAPQIGTNYEIIILGF
jgi:hypothetical protein